MSLTVSPPSPRTGSAVVATGGGFGTYKVQLLLDGVLVATVCSPTAGAFTAAFPVSSSAGTQTLTAQQSINGAWVTFTSTTITVVATPADPAPGGTFYEVPASLIAATPGGSATYTGSGSLGSFMAGIAAGSYGVLDFNGYHTENINIALANGVTIIPASGKTPGLDGSLRISGGTGVRILGLNVKWTSADPSGHMVKLDGGSIEYGYAEIHDAACYTLLRPGQTIHDWRLHHLYVHDNPGVGSHDGNQDHGIYADPPSANSNGLIDHCLIQTMPRGRNIKVGGPSSGYSAIGGITIRKCSLQDGQGPSNSQVSNGATGIAYSYCLFSRSGSSTNLTAGTGAGTGSTYSNCKGDSTVGPNNANLTDGGGNTNSVALATVENYAAQGALGYGHLAS